MNDLTRIAPLLLLLALPACGKDNKSPTQDSGTPDSSISDSGSNDSGSSDASVCGNHTFTVTNDGTTSWVIDGVSSNPPLTLCQGSTYIFDINATGHPFAIHLDGGVTSPTDRYVPLSGMAGQGTDSGQLIFTPDGNSPDTLYYQSESDADMTGTITVVLP